MRTRAKFTRPDARLILPSALAEEWPNRSTADTVAPPSDAVGVLVVRGPLEHHLDCEFDSYDAILMRATAVFAEHPQFVVMFLDSPGGVVSGCFAASRELRRMAESVGVPLYAYVEGSACSAAYALACAADFIAGPPEAVLGSIGIIAELTDQTKRDAAQGVQVHFVTSGARKADGHEHAPVTDDVLGAVGKHVGEEAAMFHAWVSARRRLSMDAIQALQCAHFHGDEAVRKGLADVVGSLDEALALFAVGATPPAMVAGAETSHAATAAKQGTHAMADSEDMAKLRANLGKKAAEDSDEGRRARKALQALDAPEDEKKDGEPEPEKKDEGEDSAEDEATTGAEDESDDARKAESESDDDAKRCEDDAKADDEEAKSAAKKAEEASARARAAATLPEAKAALREADRHQARAARARKDARIMRNQAALFRAKTKAAAAAPKPRATVADKLAGTLAASSARGTEVQPKAGAKPPMDPTATGRKAISEVSPEIRRAAGITTGAVASDPLITFDSVGMSIGARLCDPKTARDYLAGKVGA